MSTLCFGSAHIAISADERNPDIAIGITTVRRPAMVTSHSGRSGTDGVTSTAAATRPTTAVATGSDSEELDERITDETGDDVRVDVRFIKYDTMQEDRNVLSLYL
ncbi:hypothetical protein D8Y22_18195 [Salinadaptatus halalkaliphilus]|uniref:Uncharacterized protein n=1 Tax=Salinadaptatus halalkaliphilus TaxID=2419781 RepID=A0A4S3TIR8_9EURY|nr:hypothetical protein [Salinadaptatus halalkaliphilus]THE63440.1 hypothetical protein D8Y22_18195 [Salinadaptatus halalkaliphilus]